MNRWKDWWDQAARDIRHAQRYPNGFASGYPGKLYTRGEAEGAIADAEKILEFCRRRLP